MNSAKLLKLLQATYPNEETFLPRTDLTVQVARRRLASWHFSQEALNSNERAILYIAEALLCLLDAQRSPIEAVERAMQDGYIGDLYRTDYVVEGSDEFPHDMLRYTCSWPKGEVDSRAMSKDHEKRRVTLSKYHRDPKPVLSQDRWQSKFRWQVVEIIETVEL